MYNFKFKEIFKSFSAWCCTIRRAIALTVYCSALVMVSNTGISEEGVRASSALTAPDTNTMREAVTADFTVGSTTDIADTSHLDANIICNLTAADGETESSRCWVNVQHVLWFLGTPPSTYDSCVGIKTATISFYSDAAGSTAITPTSSYNPNITVSDETFLANAEFTQTIGTNICSAVDKCVYGGGNTEAYGNLKDHATYTSGAPDAWNDAVFFTDVDGSDQPNCKAIKQSDTPSLYINGQADPTLIVTGAFSYLAYKAAAQAASDAIRQDQIFGEHIGFNSKSFEHMVDFKVPVLAIKVTYTSGFTGTDLGKTNCVCSNGGTDTDGGLQFAY